jgi:uncharacterized protein YqeY
MASPREELEAQIKAALKSGDKRRLATLRLLLTAATNERIRTGQEVDESGFLQLVQKAIKQRRDSAEQYRKGNREDLAAEEDLEAEILAEFLPPQIGEEELLQAIEAFVEQEGLVGMAGLGRVMQEMMSRYRGRADGSVINGIARNVLSRQT